MKAICRFLHKRYLISACLAHKAAVPSACEAQIVMLPVVEGAYPDGSYKPDQTITRAADATKLYRFCEMMEKKLSELRAEIVRLKAKNE